MLQDMTTFYQASYIPPIQDYDGSFRTIAVKPVNARLDIKTKTGYFALAPGAEAGIRPFEVPLLKLFNQSNLPQDVKFQAAVLQFGELPDGNTSTVAIEVPISCAGNRTRIRTQISSRRTCRWWRRSRTKAGRSWSILAKISPNAVRLRCCRPILPPASFCNGISSPFPANTCLRRLFTMSRV